MASSKGRSKGEETTSLRVTSRAETLGGAGARGKSAFTLHVMRDSHVVTYPLEAGRTLVIGRSAMADIRIDDPNVSRRHAQIHVGETISIEDLGSSNGVKAGQRMLGSKETVQLESGTVVEIGGAILVVQPSAGTSAPRRVWSHGYFEGRVQDECSRGDRIGGSFAVVRVRVTRDSEARALDALSRVLNPADVVALYGPGEIEALLLEREDAHPDALSKSIVNALGAQAIAASAGVACYPGDSRAGDALLSVAEDRLAPATHRVSQAPGGRKMYGHHLAELGQVLSRIARGDINILVLGETGVGKELVAEMIHRLSPRVKKPLIRLNCSAFTEQLLASELFGYERGAFTGADRAKPGLLESADGGTVFLDEIGEMPLTLQPKLLRAIEEGEVLRLGALTPKHIDVRFVSATNRDLEAESQAGRFRGDLYFRLAGYTAMVLPLRQRPDEIVELARGFLADAATALGTTAPKISNAALSMLASYAWPGNARELRNVMQRALLLSDGNDVAVEHLPADRMTMRVAAAPSHSVPPLSSHATTAQNRTVADDRQRIIDVLAQFGGNQTYAARELGISRGTLLTRMDAFGLTRPRKKPTTT